MIAHHVLVVKNFFQVFATFFRLSFGLLSLATVCILTDSNKENNNILVNFWLQFGYNVRGVFLALAGDEC